MTRRAGNLGRSRHFDSLEQEVFLSIWRTYDRLRVLEDELFARFNLSPQQYNALRLLRAEHPNSLHTLELAERLVSRAPDITRLLDKLESRQFIERVRPSENRRVVQVRIAERGLQLLDEISGPLQECHSRQLGHMSAKDLRQLTQLLQACRQPHEAEGGVWSSSLARDKHE